MATSRMPAGSMDRLGELLAQALQLAATLDADTTTQSITTHDLQVKIVRALVHLEGTRHHPERIHRNVDWEWRIEPTTR